MSELQWKFREEYGPISRLPGAFGRPDTLFSFDPKDVETVFRTEGKWPGRNGNETFVYYRHKVRPDVFKNKGGLISEQGEEWGKMRTAVNPVMLPPKTVNTYIPKVDEVARDFLQLSIQTRDTNNELPANFGDEINKWSLESIGVIALDQRLGVLVGDDPDARLLIKSVRDFFELAFDLEVKPSLWRIISTPKFRQLMQAYDHLTK